MSESIYNFLREAPPEPEKPPMYHSKVDPLLPPSASTFSRAAVKKPFQSRELKDTVKGDNFLKAGEKTTTGGAGSAPASPARKHVPLKPAVPRREEAPLHGLSSGKNFIVSNAVEAILKVPRKPPTRDYSFLDKPDYGKVPDYLQRVKQEVAEEHAYLAALLDQHAAAEKKSADAASGIPEGMRELSQQERDELVFALKQKWDAVNKVYQLCTYKKISAATATIGEIRWKETCEQQLKQIEADIKRLTQPGPIYVTD